VFVDPELQPLQQHPAYSPLTMSYMTILGCQYKTDELLRETVDLAQLLARNARLERPLPRDTDFTEDEHNEIETQVCSIFCFVFQLFLK
jgi:hypothetical protein